MSFYTDVDVGHQTVGLNSRAADSLLPQTSCHFGRPI